MPRHSHPPGAVLQRAAAVPRLTVPDSNPRCAVALMLTTAADQVKNFIVSLSLNRSVLDAPVKAEVPGALVSVNRGAIASRGEGGAFSAVNSGRPGIEVRRSLHVYGNRGWHKASRGHAARNADRPGRHADALVNASETVAVLNWCRR